MPELAPAPRLEDAERLHVLDVRPGDESLLACAGEHHDADGLVGGELGQGVPESLCVLEVERVHRLRPLDGDDCAA